MKEYCEQLFEEYDLLPVKYWYGPKHTEEYKAEIREWLTGVIDGEGFVELESGVKLPVIREVPKHTENVYLTVKNPDRKTYATIYSIKEFG